MPRSSPPARGHVFRPLVEVAHGTACPLRTWPLCSGLVRLTSETFDRSAPALAESRKTGIETHRRPHEQNRLVASHEDASSTPNAGRPDTDPESVGQLPYRERASSAEVLEERGGYACQAMDIHVALPFVQPETYLLTRARQTAWRCHLLGPALNLPHTEEGA